MIKINLATKKRAYVPTAAAPAAPGVGSLLEKIRGALAARGGGGASSLTPQMKVNLGVGAICLIAGYAATFFWDQHRTSELNLIQVQVAEVQDQVNRLDSELAKTAGYETLKRNLENDQKAIQTKITTIEKLIEARRDPPLILKTLSEVTPRDVWLSEFSLKNADVKIAGNSRGLSPVSDFMKLLEDTIYFREVSLKRSTSKRELGQDLGQFELEAKRK